jgi:uncharacterized protein YaiE (UPF0345 family)
MNFTNVTAEAKANIYFDGKVISHSIIMPDGSKKTLGVILPGSYHFGTEAAERMDIVGGSCEVVLDGSEIASQSKATPSSTSPPTPVSPSKSPATPATTSAHFFPNVAADSIRQAN